MGKIMVFISDAFADFEVTLLLYRLRVTGKKDIVTIAYDKDVVMSDSGLRYQPDLTVSEALQMDLDSIEALIIPGGPIRPQQNALTLLIQKLDGAGKLLAAICNGPQYLARSGVLHHCQYTTSCSPEALAREGIVDPFPRQNFVIQRTIVDKNVITAQGRAFVDFSFAVFDYLNIYHGRKVEQEQLYRDIMNR